MLQDPSHLFRRMWAAEAWGTMENGRPACWEVERMGWERHRQKSDQFFNDVDSGAICNTNWYEGNAGRLGMPFPSGGARFPRRPGGARTTPALLGFDETIDEHCANQLGGMNNGPHNHAERCVAANRNILSLYGNRVPYNICRNLEWQVCAAQGKLPGQGNRKMIFAIRPSKLDPSGATGKPLGQCKGWVPGQVPVGGVYGYATDDIFYLEVCMLHQVCRNGDRLFNLRAGEEFECDYSTSKFRELQQMLLTPPEPPPPEATVCHGAELTKVKEDGAAMGLDGEPTCETCWQIATATGDCSLLRGCNSRRCDFCKNDDA